MTESLNQNDQPIEVRFVADGLVPSAVRSHEIADMLIAVEDLIVASVQRERPDLGKDTIIVGLAAVESNSIGLRFAPSPATVVVPIFRLIANTIHVQAYTSLPRVGREAVKKIAGFARKYHCRAELRTHEGLVAEVLATIGPDVDIPPAPRVSGITTIYGQVVNAGGKEPNVHVDLADGTRVTCWGTTAQVKQLASRLYTTVGIEGTARWDSETFEILDFHIIGITPYEEAPLDELFSEIRQVAGSHFSGVDALQYVHELRDNDAEM